MLWAFALLVVCGCKDKGHQMADSHMRLVTLLGSLESALYESQLLLPTNTATGVFVQVTDPVLVDIVARYKDSLPDRSPGTNITDYSGNPVRFRIVFNGMHTNALGALVPWVEATAYIARAKKPESSTDYGQSLSRKTEVLHWQYIDGDAPSVQVLPPPEADVPK